MRRFFMRLLLMPAAPSGRRLPAPSTWPACPDGITRRAPVHIDEAEVPALAGALRGRHGRGGRAGSRGDPARPRRLVPRAVEARRAAAARRCSVPCGRRFTASCRSRPTGYSGRRRRSERTRALRLWWGQLALNGAWSPLFFGAHRARLALADLVGLTVAVADYTRTAGKVESPGRLADDALPGMARLRRLAESGDRPQEPAAGRVSCSSGSRGGSDVRGRRV